VPTVLSLLAAANTAGTGAPKPFPEAVVTARKDVGARVGWM
jgi:hypothetical protein